MVISKSLVQAWSLISCAALALLLHGCKNTATQQGTGQTLANCPGSNINVEKVRTAEGEVNVARCNFAEHRICAEIKDTSTGGPKKWKDKSGHDKSFWEASGADNRLADKWDSTSEHEFLTKFTGGEGHWCIRMDRASFAIDEFGCESFGQS